MYYGPMNTANAAPNHALSAAVLELCADAGNLAWRHVDDLAESVPRDEREPLWHWAVVLGVLAADVFESSVLLLDANHIRGGNILSRALVDYDVRMRYYIVQYLKWRKKYENRKNVTLSDMRAKMHAARDWDNAPFKLGSILNLYNRDLFTPEIGKALDEVLSSKETEQNATFTDMLDYLVKNEVNARGIVPKTEDRVMPRYRNLKPIWRLQSSFSHGDQAVITDVYDFKETEYPVLRFRRGPIGPNLLVFEALFHLLELLASFEMLKVGLFGTAALQDRYNPLWQTVKDNDPVIPRPDTAR